jgi:uncharacterized membrane protein YgdD (TMEM256/DUF423 family)
MTRTFTALGAGLAFLAVALGAFGAHALKTKLSADMLAVYQTGVQYHITHALALLVVASLSEKLDNKKTVLWVGRLMVAGIILFSGSLYLLALTGVKVLGAITPLGGICFLTAWAMLAMAAVRSPREDQA